jgi:hypothetical protein
MRVPPPGAPALVAYAIQQDLAHECAQRAITAIFEAVQMCKRLKEGVLHKVRRIERPTRRAGKATVCQPAEFRSESLE